MTVPSNNSHSSFPFYSYMQMEIRAQVVGCGGEFTDLFNTRCAVLVCAKVGTEKYLVSE